MERRVTEPEATQAGRSQKIKRLHDFVLNSEGTLKNFKEKDG